MPVSVALEDGRVFRKAVPGPSRDGTGGMGASPDARRADGKARPIAYPGGGVSAPS